MSLRYKNINHKKRKYTRKNNKSNKKKIKQNTQYEQKQRIRRTLPLASMNLLKDKYSDLFPGHKIPQELCKLFFNAFRTSEKFADSYQKIIHIQRNTFNRLQTQVKPSYFMDKSIVNHIHKEIQYTLKFEATLLDIYNFEINLFYNNRDKTRQTNHIKLILFLLHFLISQNNDKIKQLNHRNFIIDIYFTDLKKGFEGGFRNKIEPKHINTGFCFQDPTINTTKIIIFRKEEWFKTLIHECLHAFNLEFNSHRINFSMLFSDTFFINSSFLVNETFVEFWARLLNTSIHTYYEIIYPKDLSSFYTRLSHNMLMERIHSIYQSSKILKLFGLEYADVINKSKEKLNKKVYIETTNAFCYYVLTSLLMIDMEKTLEWFLCDSGDRVCFMKSERQMMIFSYYLKQISSDKKILELYKNIQNENIKIKGYNMSLFQL